MKEKHAVLNTLVKTVLLLFMVFAFIYIASLFSSLWLPLLGFENKQFVKILGGVFDAHETYPIIELNAIYMVFLTALIAAIAWIQLDKLNQTSDKDKKLRRADILLRIDQHLSSPAILRAKKIIYREIFLARTELKMETPIYNDPKLLCKIQDRIIKLLKDESKAEYILIINFLNVMENVSYLYNKNYINTKDINEMFGHTFKTYLKYFETWVPIHRRNFGSDQVYEHLTQLRESEEIE